MDKPQQYTIVQFGTPQTPLPTFDSSKFKMSVLASAKGVISIPTMQQDRSKSGAAEITDERDRITVQERAYAKLMRNLPSRNMLPHLVHELVERDPNRVDLDQRSFICRYVGAPSVGKSFFIKQLGKIAHPKGVFNLNCTDVDMGTLFCETVFDTSGADIEKAAIDAKMRDGKGLSVESLHRLRTSLGDAYIEEDRNGKTVIAFDWAGIQVKGNTIAEQEFGAQIIQETLTQVCKNEGIEVSKNASQIGITTRDGIAVRAADPNSADYGRPILLDEFMRCKKGTAQKLYEWIAMLSDPRVPKVEVIGGKNRSVTIYRKDLPATFRVNPTDNPAIARMGSAELDDPLKSRFGEELDSRTVPDPEDIDFADRLGLHFTGVPLLQIYYSAKEHFDANPQDLIQVLRKYRTAALTDAEVKEIPSEQMLNLSDPMRFIKISEQFARFFASLDFKKLASEDASLAYQDYLQGVTIDLRTVMKLFEKSSVVLPETTQSWGFDYSAAFETAAPVDVSKQIDEEHRLETRGTRTVRYVLEWLERVIVPADAISRDIDLAECQTLFNAVLIQAANNGIGKASLAEAEAGGVESIEDLYNFNPLNEADAQMRLIRDLVLDEVRKEYELARVTNGYLPEMPKDNDDIATIGDMQLTLEQAIFTRSTSKPGSLGYTNSIIAPNADATFAAKAFTSMTVQDSIPAPDAQKGTSKVAFENLMQRDVFLMALALPETQEDTLASLWNNELVKHPSFEPYDDALKIASDENFESLTTLVTNHKGRLEPVHILKSYDESSLKVKNILVVSGSIEKDMQRLLKAKGVTYVDYTADNAAAQIDEAVADFVLDFSSSEQLKTKLISSFLLRNGYRKDDAANRTLGLGELMTSPDKVPPTAPMQVTNIPFVLELDQSNE